MKKRLVQVIFEATLFSGCFLFASASYAAPSVNGVSGGISDNSTINISGSNFLQGPNVILFDPFEGGSTGQIISLSGARYGSWSAYSGATAIYDSVAHSGSHGFRIYDTNEKKQATLAKSFSDTTEFFISHWFRIPDGTYFPGVTSSTFPSASVWKMLWVMDGPGGYQGDDDVCMPSWSSSAGFGIGGNDNVAKFQNTSRFFLGGNPPPWWAWGEWMRHTIYLKGGSNPTTSNGILFFQGMSASKGIKAYTKSDAPIFDGDDNDKDDSISRWNYLTVPGWVRTGYTNVRPVYDDVYVATGANARARVEIGNNKNYNECTNLSILTPQNWNSGNISATVNLGSFKQGQTAYVFVVDKDGNPSQGYPVTIGSSGPAPSAYCGDNSCNGSETCETCPGDCGQCQEPKTCSDCGDGILNACDESECFSLGNCTFNPGLLYNTCTEKGLCIDQDNDGYGVGTDTTGCLHLEKDCNDKDININPGKSDTCGDGIDQDCSGSDESCSSSGGIPVVNGISGTFSDGQTLNISGSSFGTKSKAEPLLWDTFENGTDQNADIGTWDKLANYADSSSIVRDGSKSMRNTLGSGVGSNPAKNISIKSGEKLFISIWRRFETPMPYTTDPAWQLKTMRILKEGGTSIAGPVWAGAPVMVASEVCDDTKWPSSSMIPNAATWYNEMWTLRTSSAVGASDGYFDWSRFRFDGDDVDKYTISDAITKCSQYPGDVYEVVVDSYGKFVPVNSYSHIDDVYMDNTWSRVMLCDNSNFADCKHFEMQIPENWSNNSISIKANTGTFKSGQTAYLFVVDENNNPSQGYPITIGSSGPAPSAYCGDNSCNGSETCETCPGDCGQCQEPKTCSDCGDGILNACDESECFSLGNCTFNPGLLYNTCTEKGLCIDQDNDGYGVGTDTTGCLHLEKDCNDKDININPGKSDTCGDGIDQDCSGSDESCSSSEPSDGSLTSNLSLLYHLDNNTSQGESLSNIKDYSGNNNSAATKNGAAPLPGKFSGAFDFDGNDDYIDAGTFGVSGGAMTISAWFKADDFGANDSRIISKATSSAEQDHYFMLSTITGNKLRFRLKTNNSTSTLIQSSGSISAGTWINAVAVYDGSNMILYKDGQEVGRLAKTGSITTDSSVKTLIGSNPSNYAPFDGLIDEVAVWNRALSASEVASVYSSSPLSVSDEPELTPTCGDSSCNGSETCESCPGDCGTCPASTPVCTDNDGDGYGTGDISACNNSQQDCNDNNAAIHTGAVDTCGDGIDQDCSGSDAVCSTPEPAGEGGLSLFYHLDNDGSYGENSSTLHDFSDSNNMGIISGASFANGKVGDGSLEFNGSESYVKTPNSSSLNINGSAITVSAWVYSDVDKTSIILTKPVSDSSHKSPYHSYSLHTINGTPRFWLTLNGTGRYVLSDYTPPAGTWYHVAGIYDGSTMKIYINGEEKGSLSITGNVTGYSTSLVIGANGVLGEKWDGKIDEVRIYDKALSAQEIKEIYNDSGQANENSEPVISCGDNSCNGSETCEICPEDCGICEAPTPICIDKDNDGYGAGDITVCANPQSDCNDSDALVHPNAEDICGDGIDQDCSGADTACTYGTNDFIQLVADWFKASSSRADVNKDKFINSKDLGIIMSNWKNK